MSNSDYSFAVFDALLREAGFTRVEQPDAVFLYEHKESDTVVLVRIRDMKAPVPWGIFESTRKILDGRGVLSFTDFDRRVRKLERTLGKPVLAANGAPTGVGRPRALQAPAPKPCDKEEGITAPMNGQTNFRLACDAMLGGLARWLRASGYDAFWQEGIDDSELVRRGRAEGWTLLSSDDDVFDFAVVRDGAVPSLFVPRGFGVQEQLAFVMRRLGLPLCQPRCMACGGELVEVAKEAVRDRVPPRSLAHYERFWECARCRRVYWHGTHWRKITERLREAVG